MSSDTYASRSSQQGMCVLVVFFFFQAEDGIRDLTVTGVQTCALPISETLFGAGLVRRPDHPIKLLGTGDVAGRKFVVKGVAVSASAKQKIEQAGGTIA